MAVKAYIKDDFKNINDFRKWSTGLGESLISKAPQGIQDLLNDRSTQKYIKSGEFGKNVTLEQLKAGIQEFQDLNLIDEIESKFEDGIATSSANTIPLKKLSYNDLGLGVFSFDRAAQGMYQLMEYYSPSYKKSFDVSEVQQIGNDEYILKADNSPIIYRLENKENGLPKVRTTNKKVFAYFPKVQRQRAAVEIYVSCGNYANVSAEVFLYSGMAAVIVAKKLIKAGIPVKINTVIGWQEDNSTPSTYCCAVVPLKNYDEQLDVNILATVTSDPRFWRYEGYRACTNLQVLNGVRVSGGGLIGRDLKKVFEENKYRLEVQNRFYFGRIQSKGEALREIEDALKQVSESLSKKS